MLYFLDSNLSVLFNIELFDISEFAKFSKALHCPSRWVVVDILRSGPKSSDEIYTIMQEQIEGRDKSPDNIEKLKDNCNGECKHEMKKMLSKPSFYYHLRELESAGIIEFHEFKPSASKKAPEKVWKLKIEKFFIKMN